MSLKIVSDANIPFVKEMFSDCEILDLIPGHKIDHTSIKDADALLIRSITRIDEQLLQGTSVKFVGSATAGLDHIDVPYLNRSGIRFSNAPGGNAESVVEYVLSALFVIAFSRQYSIFDATLGVIGCGQIGSRLSARAKALGLRVLENDPPLQRKAEQRGLFHHYVSLDTILAQSDIISLHVPLTSGCLDATDGLIGAGSLDSMRPGTWLVNTARGGIVNERDLMRIMDQGVGRELVMDVWENEPNPNSVLQARTSIATPHIAGYSRDAKLSSTRMIFDAFRSHFELPEIDSPDVFMADFSCVLKRPKTHPKNNLATYIYELNEQMYRIREDHNRMKGLPEAPEATRSRAFRQLRSEYPARYTFSRFSLDDARLTDEVICRLEQGLGIQIGG